MRRQGRGRSEWPERGAGTATAARSEEGSRLVELYLDERASPEQSSALESIFSGKAGGHLQVIAPRIGAITAVQPTAIAFEKEQTETPAALGDVLDAEGQELIGMDGANPTVITNPNVWAGVTQPLRQAKAERIHYAGGWTFDSTDTNSFIAEFKYQS